MEGVSEMYVQLLCFIETVLVEDDDENSQSAEVLNTESTTGKYNVKNAFFF